jgi:hypothetical protein
MNKDKIVAEIKRIVANFGDFHFDNGKVTLEGFSQVFNNDHFRTTFLSPLHTLEEDLLKEILEEMYIIHFQTTVDDTQFA